MSEPLNSGAPLPPHGQQRWWKIISPGQHRPLGVVLNGDTFFGQWTHYVPPTLPCSRRPECVYCKGGLGSRFSGYIPCVQRLDREQYVLGLTYGACKQLLGHLAERGTLRGIEVVLSRKHPAPNAPVVVKVQRTVIVSQLPAPFDVQDSLSRMWGVNREFLARGCRRLSDVFTKPDRIGEARVREFMHSYNQQQHLEAE